VRQTPQTSTHKVFARPGSALVFSPIGRGLVSLCRWRGNGFQMHRQPTSNHTSSAHQGGTQPRIGKNITTKPRGKEGWISRGWFFRSLAHELAFRARDSTLIAYNNLTLPKRAAVGVHLVHQFLFFSTTATRHPTPWRENRWRTSTAAMGGQVRFETRFRNPASPFGMVVFPILVFFFRAADDWAVASAPAYPLWNGGIAWRSSWMALAGRRPTSR